MIKSFDSNSFIKALDAKLIIFLNEVLEGDFLLTLVGGAVRDYFLGGQISEDLDFEIRYKKKIPLEDFDREILLHFNQIKKKNNLKLTVLPFHIYKIDFGLYELEFSIPRKESFPDRDLAKGHSEFKVSLNPLLKEKESFLRRDLTINSMGIKLEKDFCLKGAQFIDPFSGLIDLRSKIFRSQNPDFYLDPVRFLRLIRFKIKYNYDFFSHIDFKRFNLEKLLFYHFEKEFNKSDKVGFIKLFLDLIKEFHIKTPKPFFSLVCFRDHFFQEEGKTLKEVSYFYYNRSEMREEDLLSLASLFSWKRKDSLFLISLKKTLAEFTPSKIRDVNQSLDDLAFLNNIIRLYDLLSTRSMTSLKSFYLSDLQVKKIVFFNSLWPLGFKKTFDVDIDFVETSKRNHRLTLFKKYFKKKHHF